MKHKIYIIDAFTNKNFSGNQAAVVPLTDWMPDSLMQSIATENNLSETAFYVKNQAGAYHIRWFSPIREVDFCGHATLASSCVIFQEDATVTAISFWAKAIGSISVQRGEGGLIEMCFPNRAPHALESADIPSALKQGLSITPSLYLKNQQAYFAIYEHEEDVRNVVSDSAIIKQLDPFDVVVSAPSKEYDFVSRYFWPAGGGDEDPVTGSIHAGLAPYWGERLNKTTMIAMQASARSGILYCRLADGQVFVAGYCVAYLSGTIDV